MSLLVFSEFITPRLTYIFEFVFKELLGVEVLFATHIEEYQQWEGIKLHYAQEKKTQEGVFIKAHSLLFECGVRQVDLNLVVHEGETFPFGVEGSIFSFDPFAAAFFVMSRYEEMLEHNTDSLGRFPARESLLFRIGCLDRPVVHVWAALIARRLAAYFPGFAWKLPIYRYVPTYDIDVAYAYKGRSWLHTSGTLLRDVLRGRRDTARERWRVVNGIRQDPYDTYDMLEEALAKYSLDPVFFFLLGNRSPRDHNLSHRARTMHRLIRTIGSRWEVGLHPSTISGEIQGRLKEERIRLEKVLGREVHQSRQHFLLIDFPGTYHALERVGITDDYSMGYADMPGYRAGVSIPFQFYDLSSDRISSIRVHPFAVMDGTLNHYLQLDPGEAKNQLDILMAHSRRWGGAFMSVWHNSSLSEMQEWSGWRAVHDYLLEHAKE